MRARPGDWPGPAQQLHGPFESGSGALKVSALASTRKLCSGPPGVMELQGKSLAALQNVVTYKMEGNMLWIRDAGGATRMIAIR